MGNHSTEEIIDALKRCAIFSQTMQQCDGCAYHDAGIDCDAVLREEAAEQLSVLFADYKCLLGKAQALAEGFDELEEAVSVAFRDAKVRWSEARKDTYDLSKAAFEKGRWCAFKDVLEWMSTKGGTVSE